MSIEPVAGTEERPLIVYVEDDYDTFKLTELRLRAKYRVLWAKNDREACALFCAHDGNLLAILMDLDLAGSQLDGLGLIKLLRGKLARAPDYAQLVPKSSVPILVLTASSSGYAELEVRAQGASHYLGKPIDFTRLNLALAQVNIARVMGRLAGRRDSAEIPVVAASREAERR